MKWLRALWFYLTTDHRAVIREAVEELERSKAIADLHRLRAEQAAEIAELKRRKKKFSHLEPGLQATVNELLRLRA